MSENLNRRRPLPGAQAGALGRKYHSEEAELRLLVRFADERHGVRGSTNSRRPCLMTSWPRGPGRVRAASTISLASSPASWTGPSPRSCSRLSAAAGTRRRGRPRRASRSCSTPAQARQLLDAAAALPDNARAAQRGPTYPRLFALCYGLGLRAGEACGLRLGDSTPTAACSSCVGGKFGKSRLVPHGPRIGRLVRRAARASPRGRRARAAAPLFSFDGRRCVHPGTASQVFHHLVTTLGLPVPDGVSPPTAARSAALLCGRAACCAGIAKGSTRARRLYQLSTFMGHVNPVSTAVYLTITPALLERGQPPLRGLRPAGAGRRRRDEPSPAARRHPALVLRRPPRSPSRDCAPPRCAATATRSGCSSCSPPPTKAPRSPA